MKNTYRNKNNGRAKTIRVIDNITAVTSYPTLKTFKAKEVKTHQPIYTQ